MSVVPPTTLAALKTWAAQKRSLYVEEQQPIASVLGQLKRDRNAAGAGEARMRQKWPEVYTGDGLLVERVVRTLREVPRLVLTYNYVLSWPWRVPIRAQAEDIGIPKREYWTQLEIAENAVDSGLQLLQTVRTFSGGVTD